MTEDLYDLFEISSEASQDEIKDAYREQVRVYHPDLNDDPRARAQFTAVKKAYDILGDPVERKAYDRLGHETYVAKRTSGLPSPDVWRSDPETDGEEEADDDNEADEKTETTATASAGASASTASGRSAGTESDAGRSTKSTSTEARSSGSRSARSAAGSTKNASSTASTTASSATSSGAGSSGNASSGRTSRTSATGSGSKSGETGGNAAVRWWRRRNFALPLLWLSLAVYLAGLGHVASANAGALETIRSELTAAGGDPERLWAVLAGGRHGLETTVGFVAGVELVAPPLEPVQWYGGLAGAVGLTLAAILLARVVRDGDIRRPVTIDETILVALAVGATTTLVGGPLLAGTVLMPLLFGVVVSHTRRGAGWTPSYLYVLPVLAPAGGFAAVLAGYDALAVDLVAFVLVPVVGALCLPLRATIKKRFGR
jgi:curved DNA-binding protein CbpA